MRRIALGIIASVAFFVAYVGGFFDRDPSLKVNYGGEIVEFEVKLSDRLVPEVMEVNYRSSVCTRTRYGHSGGRSVIDGFNQFMLTLSPSERAGIYTASIPLDGGGSCRWKLSNIALDITYVNTSDFGDGLAFAGGAGIVVMFDRNNAQRAEGEPLSNYGDLVIRRNYYPWAHMGPENKFLKLVGGVHGYETYNSPLARKVYIEPILHRDFITRSIASKDEHGKRKILYTYPDGSSELTGFITPTVYELEAIRKNMEGVSVQPDT